MISFRGFDVSKYKVKITEHAILRALERNVDPELIHLACKGKVQHFGKHYIRFLSKGKRSIVCVGEVRGEQIQIFTVEVK